MTPATFKSCLDSLGLTQAGAARLLDVHHVTVRKWASGATAIPGPAARFLRYLVATGTTSEQVEEALRA